MDKLLDSQQERQTLVLPLPEASWVTLGQYVPLSLKEHQSLGQPGGKTKHPKVMAVVVGT